MDIRTGLEIFRSLWLIEPQAALDYLSFWEHSRATGERFNYRAEGFVPVNMRAKFFAQNNVVFAPTDTWAARDFAGFDNADLAVIPVTGPIMKNDYCGEFGTSSLMSLFNQAQNSNAKAVVVLMDTPGGSVDGTQPFADAIANAEKYTATIVDGMWCSAGVWIGSGADKIISTAATNIIGSIGTMFQWVDRSKYLESMGIVVKEAYATQSTDKNRAFREANAGDTKLLVQSMLDPINSEFVNSVLDNRQGKLDLKKENVVTGQTYTSRAGVDNGLIDAIMPLQQAFNDVLDSAEQQRKQNFSFYNPALNMKWQKLLSFFGISNISGAADIKLTEANADNLEALITERDGLNTQVSDLQSNLNTVTQERDQALQTAQQHQTTIDGLNTRIEAFEKMQLNGGLKPGAVDNDPSQKPSDPWAAFRTSADDDMDKIKQYAK